ncbi:arginase family protein [Cognatiyoonia sp. IB215182]|uniref:arginase family protein n=1 Tax=Cognatiyoonia sp. IB215182 TaxID=3097353 RepID=UPI002A14715B|nr:arginase family protein [Cognatiyoonia sp. IB215182]MDX8355855.1 arginase family protein [Cognatiyoonia sp. IB215182]
MASGIFNTPTQSFLYTDVVPVESLNSGDIAVFGAPHGTSYGGLGDVNYNVATDSANAPRAIRHAANESSSNIDHYDFDLGGPLMAGGQRRLVDLGDLDLGVGKGEDNRQAIQGATTSVLQRGATPVILGGDDSIPIPFLRAFADRGSIDILQIDAHIDWRDRIDGEPDGYSSTMRRASELPFVRSITQIGMRGVGSARPQEVQTALDWGARLITVAETRKLGRQGITDTIPTGGNLLLQLDCDALDTSVCPAVNAPTPGGFQYDELADVIRTVIAQRQTVGFSIVELVPTLDSNMISAIAAARITCNVIGSLARSFT